MRFYVLFYVTLTRMILHSLYKNILTLLFLFFFGILCFGFLSFFSFVFARHVYFLLLQKHTLVKRKSQSKKMTAKMKHQKLSLKFPSKNCKFKNAL